MPWTYDPKEAVECLPAGEYDAELMSVVEKTSKAGRPMLELAWSVFKDGRSWRVHDWIVQPTTLYKLKDLARSWDMLAGFDGGTFQPEEHIGSVARLVLGVQKDDSFPDRNVVKGYRSRNPVQPAPERPRPTFEGEEIPF